MADHPTIAKPERHSAFGGTSQPQYKPWIVFFWLAAITLAGLQEWSSRHTVSQDAVSYIEVAEAYARGDWNNALNAYWSPMYCWILAVSRFLWPPSPYWEATALHMTNIPIHLFTLASFHFFWKRLTQFRHRPDAADLDQDCTTPSLPLWTILGYTLFLWSSFAFSRATGADTLVTGFVLLSAGLLLRIQSGRDAWGSYVLLGIVLGLGYLAKAILLPVGLVCLAVALFCSPRARKRIPHLLAAGIAMALVAAPFVAALSSKMGRFTTGETGRLNYAWLAGKPTTQTQPPTTQEAPYFPRRVLDLPTVEEFATPVAGTYPMWYDPAHWNRHLRVHLDRWRQWTLLLQNLGIYYEILFVQQAGILATLLVLLLLAANRGRRLRDIASAYPILIPAITPLGLYALLSVEPRFLGGSMILIWSALLCAVRLPAGTPYERLLHAAGLVLILVMAVPIAQAELHPAQRALKDIRARRDTAPHPQWYVAQALQEQGLRPGDRVAILGSINPYWARLAGARVIARIPDAHAQLFLAANDKTRAEVQAALAGIQVRALVARSGPLVDPALETGPWRRLAHTDHYVFPIPK
ncbi:MAG: hypothetical protein KA354_17905 [Phycisphaerae bacterium]|nr:hypothetical protein [Phycisphaerae bacterium]